jgi:hypothetical protein
MSAIAAETLGERIAFLHACAGSPALTTFRDAIQNGNYTTWPELSAQRVDKYLIAPAATIMGHLDQQRKDIRSTKPKAKPKAASPYQLPGKSETPEEQQPTIAEERCNHVYLTYTEITGQIYTDQPGKFITTSASGNKYVMVAYCYDSNAIIAMPMPNRNAQSLLTAYKQIHKLLTSRGFRPKFQRLDNEISGIFKDFLNKVDIDFQLTPTGSHRCNSAERAIRTWKNHFIAILCSTDETFPLKLWDRLLEPTQITLNLLRNSRVNPQLSAYAQLFGPFDFNRTPLGPPGTRVLVHELPNKRGTWSPHAVYGFCTGPAMEHYRCYKIWIQETESERIANTVVWFPTRVTLPRTSSADAATTAAQDLIHVLQNPHPASPLSPLTDEHQSALRQLAGIFNTAAPQPPLPKPNATQTEAEPAPSPRVPSKPATATAPPDASPAAAPRVHNPQTAPRVNNTKDGFTYVQRTRNRGQLRRAQAKQRKTATSTATTNRFAALEESTATVLPTTTRAPQERKSAKRHATAQLPRQPEPHRHGTRAKKRYQAARQAANNIETVEPSHRQHFVNAVIDP